ncbi:MAG TPA: hypothetical protein PLA69_06930, partial [Flavobacterium sp.]|nr:hypothetical protein [Flavobacterium sp.]
MEKLFLRPYLKSLLFIVLSIGLTVVAAPNRSIGGVENEINTPKAAVPGATISGTTTVCRGSAQPVITLTGSGETAPYTFVYNINGGPNITSPPTPAGQDFIEIPVPTTTNGTFTYNLVSVSCTTSGCVSPATGSATVTVTGPTATILGTASACLNGTAPIVRINGFNGTAPYTFTYNINGGPNIVGTTTSGNQLQIPVNNTVLG